MADPADKPRPRGGADRVRRVNAHRPPPLALSPSGEDRTEAVVAWAHRVLARLGHSRGGSAP